MTVAEIKRFKVFGTRASRECTPETPAGRPGGELDKRWGRRVFQELGEAVLGVLESALEKLA